MIKEPYHPSLVASDLGGTLVPPGRERVPYETLAVLDAIMNLGVPVALVTGFNLQTTRNMLTGLNGTPWLLVQNGTTAVRDGKTIWELGLHPEHAEKLVKLLEALRVPVIVYRDLSRGGVPEYLASGSFRKGPPFRAVAEFRDFTGITGVSTRVTNNRVGEVKAALEHNLSIDSRLILSPGTSRTWIEITPAGARKDRALIRLCGELGIAVKRMIYFGDNLNDLEALRIAGLPRVVADARPELRAEFPVTGSSAGQGPARELAEIFGFRRRKDTGFSRQEKRKPC